MGGRRTAGQSVKSELILAGSSGAAAAAAAAQSSVPNLGCTDKTSQLIVWLRSGALFAGGSPRCGSPRCGSPEEGLEPRKVLRLAASVFLFFSPFGGKLHFLGRISEN